MGTRLGSSLFCVLLVHCSAWGQVQTCWEYETIDLNGTGYNSSLLIAPDGQMSVAYLGINPPVVKYAHLDDGIWNIETVDSGGGSYWATTLAFSPQGVPSICYFEGASQEVRLATKAGKEWTVETVAQSNGIDLLGQMGFGFGPTGYPLISFPRGGGLFEVWVTQFDGEAWVEMVVATGSSPTGEWTALAFSQDGQAALAYNSGYSSIKVAILEGSTWTPVGSLGLGGGISTFGLAYSSANEISVAYNRYTSGSLRFAQRDIAGNWTIEDVDLAGGSFNGNNADIAFDQFDEPVISYASNTVPDELRLAHKQAGSWNIEILDFLAPYVLETSLLVNPDQSRALTYGSGNYDSIGALLFAYSPAGDEDCNTNGILDECDIYAGTSADLNQDGVPDECVTPACEGDANNDGTVDPLDSGYVLARFGCPVGKGDSSCDAADANSDGVVDPMDSGFVLARFGECP